MRPDKDHPWDPSLCGWCDRPWLTHNARGQCPTGMTIAEAVVGTVLGVAAIAAVSLCGFPEVWR